MYKIYCLKHSHVHVHVCQYVCMHVKGQSYCLWGEGGGPITFLAIKMTPPSNAACSGPSLLPFNFCVSIVETVVHVFYFLLSKSSHHLGQNGQL